MASPSSFSSPHNWVYDVFPSFSGEDVRLTFLSHFLKELDRKLIIAFRDSKIERGRSLDPELKKAIKDSRIAVVIFSKNYASSSWCLNELLEIVSCKDEFGQTVIPVFYGLVPSDVRKQTGDFGEIFEETCQDKTEEVKIQWRKALTNVANIIGYHSVICGNEAEMIEEIVNDVLDKLLLTTSKDSEDFVGIEDHIAEMSVLLELKSENVRMVGIWGSSGVGKTTIARVLFSRLSRHFQGSVFIDMHFISKSMKIYRRSNPDDYNMKLHLQESLLSKILNKEGIKVDHLGAIRERLKHQKVLIIIDDLDDQVVLDALVGQTQWFGCGSRIIVITKDKHFLRAHGIDHIYQVPLPSNKLALEMFCQSTFRKFFPPDGFTELASEVALLAGNLPLGLNVLGSYLRGREKEDWIDMLPSLRNRLNGKIGRTLRVSYDGLNNKKDEAIFRHIACLLHGEEVTNIKLLLADSDLDVNIGLKNLVDKSLINVREDIVEMHCLLQDMGKEIVCAQSKEPGEREFLVDSEEICTLLQDNNGTKNVLGIALNMDEIGELHIHENAFKEMSNLRFLKFFAKKWDQKKEVMWHLSEGFNCFTHKLRLLRLDRYPMRCMPSNFCPRNLVKLHMRNSKLEKLWDGVQSLRGLKDMDLFGSKNLKEIPDLSMATNLEKLVLEDCTSLVELPYTIQHLNKLEVLDLTSCENLETLPIGINLKSLSLFSLDGCSRLKSFPCISANISELILNQTRIEEFPSNLRLQNLGYLAMYGMKSEKLWDRVEPLAQIMTMQSPSLESLTLSDIPSLVEIPSSLQNFSKLNNLSITKCINLEIIPTDFNFEFLNRLDLSGCSRLSKFHNMSTNIKELNLSETGIEEVSHWIENFPLLTLLRMDGCNKLRYVSLNICKLKYLEGVIFSDCGALTKAIWKHCPNMMVVETNSIHLLVPREASSSLPCDHVPKVKFNFVNCFNLDREAMFQQQSVFDLLNLSGDEVPSYFTHQTSEKCSLVIPLLQTPLSRKFIRIRACTVVDILSLSRYGIFRLYITCKLINRLGNNYDYPYRLNSFLGYNMGSQLVIVDFCIPLNKDHVPLAKLNYDHMEIWFHMSGPDYMFTMKRWGIRVLENCSSSEKQLGASTTIPHVCEADEDSMVNETKHCQECDAAPNRLKEAPSGCDLCEIKKPLTCPISKHRRNT